MDENGAKEFRKLCNSKCEEINFKFNQDEIKNGVTVCCTYREFLNNVLFLPKLVPVNSKLLTCPH